MIYLGDRIGCPSTFALYNGELIECPDSNFAGAGIRFFRRNAIFMNTSEQRQAHHFPECRDIFWSLKLPYSFSIWNRLNHVGTVIN